MHALGVLNHPRCLSNASRLVCAMTLAFIAFAAARASAQYSTQPIQFLNQPAAASQAAQQRLKPILVWVPGGSDEDDSDIDDRQSTAMRSPLVVEIVNRYFVPLRLNRTTQTLPILNQLGLPVNYGLYMAVVPPDTFTPNSAATKISLIDPISVADPNLLATALMNARKSYGEKLYGDEIKPLFESEDPTPQNLNRALGIIATYGIAPSDEGILKLLESRADDRKFVKTAYDTLAETSTQRGVEFLWKQAQSGSKEALDALGQITPDMAEKVLLPQLRADKPEDRYLAYRAVAKLMKLRPIRAEKWWENAKEKQVEDEHVRITQIVQASAQQWREGMGRYR